MIKKLQAKFQDKLFNTIHLNNLVYNTCWEDPRVDRKLLQIDNKSKIVMITSAGCNALDYLLDNPLEINSIDMNPRQNALLDLKLALFKNGKFSDLTKFFVLGKHKFAEKIYKKNLKEHLKQESIEYWNDKIKFFTDNGKRKTFYYRGTSGKFASIFKRFAKSKSGLSEAIDDLFNANNIEEQKKAYKKIEPIFSSVVLKWFLSRKVTLSLLGIPRDQYQLIMAEYPDGLQGYLKDKFKSIFTTLSIKDNYFWRVYFYGQYSTKCKPNYLKKKNFPLLKENLYKVHTYTTTITDFLIAHPKQYTHFVLLDHQDWLAVNNPTALKDEWKQILKNSKSGTKILLRSASFDRNFLPKFVLDAVDFNDELVALYNLKDRVGTYASTHLGIVK